jgi:hypothetical protein
VTAAQQAGRAGLTSRLPDGTRAGIIDQTINVTFLPAIFGGAPPSTTAHHHAEGPHAADQTHYGLHSTMATPHPFANYASGSAFPSAPQTAGGAMSSLFSRFGGGSTSAAPAAKSGTHSPTTPYSLWGSSRAHTPRPPGPAAALQRLGAAERAPGLDAARQHAAERQRRVRRG